MTTEQKEEVTKALEETPVVVLERLAFSEETVYRLRLIIRSIILRYGEYSWAGEKEVRLGEGNPDTNKSFAELNVIESIDPETGDLVLVVVRHK